MSVPAVRGARAAFCCALLASCGGTQKSASAESAAAPAKSSADSTVASQPSAQLSPWTVTEYGMGQLRAGMSYSEANDSLKGALIAAKGAHLSECDYVHWRGAPPGVLVMVDENKIARVDVDSTGVTTREGAGVGATEAEIQAMYPGRVVVSPHKYTDGHYLTVRPVNPADSLYRIIFETDKGKVTNFHAGIMPAVEYIEGCS